MAYQLKNSGLALEVISLVLVDSDGDTIVDLAVETQTLVRHQLVTTGAKNWKGVSRGFFETTGSGINAYGISWETANRPAVPTESSNGCAVFVAYAGMSPGTASTSVNNVAVNIGGSGAQVAQSGLTFAGGTLGAGFRMGASAHAVGETIPPLDGDTSFSVGANWRIGLSHEDATSQPFFGLESGAIAADAEDSKPGNYGASGTAMAAIGGLNGYGSQPAKVHAVIVFRRKLTPSEFEALHADWFGLLVAASENLPEEPTGLTVTGVAGTSATLTWADNASTETGYEVQFRNVTNSGSWIAVAGSPFPPNTTTATKSNFSPAGHTFQMRVRAISASGESPWATSDSFVIPGSGSASIEITPASLSIEVGADGVLGLARSAAAPSGGITYNLSSSAPAVASVPATVVLLSGISELAIPVTAAGLGSATITATNSSDSGESDTATVTVIAATKIKLLAHIDAVGATNVRGIVHRASGGSALAGEYVGQFEGAAFSGAAEGGQAVLKVRRSDLSDPDVVLTESEDLVCAWAAESASGSALGNAVQIGSAGVHDCVVIKE